MLGTIPEGPFLCAWPDLLLGWGSQCVYLEGVSPVSFSPWFRILVQRLTVGRCGFVYCNPSMRIATSSRPAWSRYKLFLLNNLGGTVNGGGGSPSPLSPIYMCFAFTLSFPVYVLVPVFELGTQVHALRCSYFPVVLCVDLVSRDTTSPPWAAMDQRSPTWASPWGKHTKQSFAGHLGHL